MLSHWICTHHCGTLSQGMGFPRGKPGVWETWGGGEKTLGLLNSLWCFPNLWLLPLSFLQTSMTHIFPPRLNLVQQAPNTASFPWFPYNHDAGVTSRCGFLTGVSGGSHICLQFSSYLPFSITWWVSFDACCENCDDFFQDGRIWRKGRRIPGVLWLLIVF